jgi:hypothetical protein
MKYLKFLLSSLIRSLTLFSQLILYSYEVEAEGDDQLKYCWKESSQRVNLLPITKYHRPCVENRSKIVENL